MGSADADPVLRYYPAKAFSGKEYADFRELIIEDIQSGLRDNLRYLQALYEGALHAESENEILARIDIDEIRKKMEPELYVDLFQSVLDSEVIQRYLIALKTLEKKGFNNYNTLVILYVNSL
jgi:flagellar motor switch protein FliG